MEDNYEDIIEDEISDETEDAEDQAAAPLGVENVYHLKLPYSKESIFATSKIPLDVVRYAATDESGYSPTTADKRHGQVVIVPTRYGLDAAQLLGRCTKTQGIKKSEIVEIERFATADDIKRIEALKAKEKSAFLVFKEKASARNLNMKAISVHFMFDGQKALFFFSADTRIDFRDLVRDLVGQFRMRIELRQVGSRDEARMMGALGACGRPLCCSTVTDRMRPVSIKMAKEQSLSLNSSKISGQCARLMCCLSYENDWYTQARRNMPLEGVRVTYDGTVFRVAESNPISGMVRMLGEDGRVIEVNGKRFHREDNGRWEIE